MEEYKPRSILLTGGCGFIGSHVVIKLVREYGYKVMSPPLCGFRLFPRGLANCRFTPWRLQVIVLDIMDYCSNIRNLDCVKGCGNLKVRCTVCVHAGVRYWRNGIVVQRSNYH